jgi:hypothetical protein
MSQDGDQSEPSDVSQLLENQRSEIVRQDCSATLRALDALAELSYGGRRYEDLDDALDGIAHKVLTLTVTELANEGLDASTAVGKPNRKAGR